MSEKKSEKGQKNVHHQRGCDLTEFLILVITLGAGRSLLYCFLSNKIINEISCGCSLSSSYYPWQP
jgi:hypothetical protein